MTNLNNDENLIKLINDLKITNFSIYNYEDGSKSIEFYRDLETVEAGIKIELPEKYTITEDITTLYWKDGTYTKVKRCEDDEFNPRLAFLTAFFQKYSGMSKNKANKYLSSLKVSYPLKSKKEERLVEVVDVGKTYSSYDEFVKKYFPKYLLNFKKEETPKQGKKYLYLGENKHLLFTDIILFLIQDRDTKQVYVIGKKGIKDYQPKHAKEEFKIGDRVYNKNFGWGIIVEIKDKQMFYKYLVLFDNQNLILHSGSISASRSYPEHRCWWCQDKDISKEEN